MVLTFSAGAKGAVLCGQDIEFACGTQLPVGVALEDAYNSDKRNENP